LLAALPTGSGVETGKAKKEAVEKKQRIGEE
jgi:hypothetical protein